jgi:hypothetical protein
MFLSCRLRRFTAAHLIYIKNTAVCEAVVFYKMFCGERLLLGRILWYAGQGGIENRAGSSYRIALG